MTFVRAGSGQHLARVVHGLLDLGFTLSIARLRHHQPALNCRSHFDALQPTANVAETIEAHTRPFVCAHPGERGDVGDGVVANQVVTPRETTLENLVEAPLTSFMRY